MKPPAALLLRSAAVPVLPYRACELCDFGALLAGERRCRCPAALATQGEHPVTPARAVPVARLRAPDGTCGPDARHMRASFL